VRASWGATGGGRAGATGHDTTRRRDVSRAPRYRPPPRDTIVVVVVVVVVILVIIVVIIVFHHLFLPILPVIPPRDGLFYRQFAARKKRSRVNGVPNEEKEEEEKEEDKEKVTSADLEEIAKL